MGTGIVGATHAASISVFRRFLRRSVCRGILPHRPRSVGDHCGAIARQRFAGEPRAQGRPIAAHPGEEPQRREHAVRGQGPGPGGAATVAGRLRAGGQRDRTAAAGAGRRALHLLNCPICCSFRAAAPLGRRLDDSGTFEVTDACKNSVPPDLMNVAPFAFSKDWSLMRPAQARACRKSE